MMLKTVAALGKVASAAAAAESDNDDTVSLYSSSSSSTTTVVNDVYFLDFPPDNASQHHYECSIYSCEGVCHKNIVWKILQWMKVIALKIGRSYYAIPVALLTTTLLIGILIGFWMGQKYSEEQKQQNRKTIQKTTANRTTIWQRILNSCRSICYNIQIYIQIMNSQVTTNFLSSPSSCQEEKVFCLTETIDTKKKTTSGKDDNDNDDDDNNNSNTLLVGENNNKMDVDTMDVVDNIARVDLKSNREYSCESGIPTHLLPHHIAVIMDGNRRYGTKMYNGNATKGHVDGSRKLVQFAKWCLAEHIPILTVYAFSTENWQRDPTEVAALMSLIGQYCEELRIEALQRNIRVDIISTDASYIPSHIQQALQRLQHDTAHANPNPRLQMNICLSYGGRREILNACESIAHDYQTGTLHGTLTEDQFQQRLSCPSNPDVLLRTSGEVRISNFLLWQLAYTEFFFIHKNWPEVEKQDFLQIIRDYAQGRQRRYGK